jgi:branched-chain amino acid transport system permease protein
MAVSVGTIVFVVVVFGGMGSLAGAFIASLIIGAVQTFSVAFDYSLLSLFGTIGIKVNTESGWMELWKVTIAQAAPVLPYLLMVAMLIVRPKGLMGTREG